MTTPSKGVGLTNSLTTSPRIPLEAGRRRAVSAVSLLANGGSTVDADTGLATTSNGPGTGLTVDVAAAEGVATGFTIAAPGVGYAVGQTFTVTGIGATPVRGTITNTTTI